MKAIILSVLLLGVLVSGCNNKQTDEDDANWRAYCAVYGINVDTPTTEQENYFLDCWCGSVEEEEALSSNE